MRPDEAKFDRRTLMQLTGASLAVLGAASLSSSAKAQPMPKDGDNFYKSDRVTVRKVTFKTQYRTTVPATSFCPRTSTRAPGQPRSWSDTRWAR